MLHSPFTPLQDSVPPIGREQMYLTFNPFRPIKEGSSSMHGRYSIYVKEDNLTHPNEKNKISPRDWTDSIDDTLQMYVLGDTLSHSRAWKDVDYVYLPVNNNGQHWLAAKVDLLSRHITLYDSAPYTSNDLFQCNNVECLSVLFPYLLDVGGFYDDRPELKLEGTYLRPFTMSRMDKDKCPK
ncbi:hypothetical protein FNV43_RR16810 [Rhamnella rubrinervis]|uniref:Ubiquitin-like protease family profile domain-containing protein n=1 Tax=Rhamnella rubrinervis TaxID=2594499 RepID=A0A8K0GZF8_9ROSA|nr:hypothetical protein FNV43_RR16810 [Rhamnella rubrinervis]